VTWDTLEQAVLSARRNWLRSLLTMCGLSVGVMGFGASGMTARGVREGLWSELAELTDDVIEVEWQATTPAEGPLVGPPKPLDQDDVDTIARLPGVLSAYAAIYRPRVKVRHGQVELAAGFEAVPPVPSGTPHYRLASGREFLPWEQAGRVGVCYLGQELAARLFPGQDAVGRTVLCNGAPFLVVGTLRARPDFFRRNANYRVVVPLARAGDVLPRLQSLDTITIRTRGAEEMDGVASEVERLLRASHGVRNYRIMVPREMVEKQKRIFYGVVAVVFALSQISLLVSGIGIMNVLVFSVKERTREIGVRLACGSPPRRIFLLITLEALVLCAGGGIAGCLLSYPTAILLGRGARLAMPGGMAAAPAFDLSIVGLSLALALLTGALSGLYPSYLASRLEPAECLRNK
jgi:hypothetical protein